MNKNDGAYEQRLAKLKKDGNGVVRTTSRIEDANRDDTNEAIPKWTKKSGLKRGEGWAEEGLDRFQVLLDMVHEDRNVEENKVVEDQLLKFWSEIEKGKKRKMKRRVDFRLHACRSVLTRVWPVLSHRSMAHAPACWLISVAGGS